jgi:molecular chaperone DnaK
MNGVLQLVDVPPVSRAPQQIEVTFDVDACGILQVIAKDLAANSEGRITVSSYPPPGDSKGLLNARMLYRR